MVVKMSSSSLIFDSFLFKVIGAKYKFYLDGSSSKSIALISYAQQI